MRLEEEKELLVLKGNILRLKLSSQGNTAKREISSPLQNINLLGSVLNQPLIHSLLFTAVSKKIFTARSIVVTALGLVTLLALGKHNQHDQSE
ncbi:hypothetical protein [Aggregatibacter segnis]|uniref:hypothetical protein n=1 Tax=Aggregatibacter segnis TaxID=739 RepID=UPI000D658BF6|nr:hypothetical protein [Aggregatibacter segnis]